MTGPMDCGHPEPHKPTEFDLIADLYERLRVESSKRYQLSLVVGKLIERIDALEGRQS